MKKLLTKNNMIKALVILGVIIIPLLYSYFYLGAFWDPYSRLDQVPVAIVNLDKGAIVNDAQRNVGDEVCKELKADGTLKFVFTDEEDAKKGTEGDDYYAMIVIPSDFSANIASAGSTKKVTATILYAANEKKNYLASQILNNAAVEIEKSVLSNVNKEVVVQLSDKLQSVPEQMAELQDGLNQLYDGSVKLSNGTTTLNTGSATLLNGTNQLNDGIGTLQDGAVELAQGTKRLTGGTEDLAAGAAEFYKKFGEYKAAFGTAQAGAAAVYEGAATLNGGITAMSNQVNSDSVNMLLQLKDTDLIPAGMVKPIVQNVKGAVSLLKDGSDQLAAGAKNLNTGMSGLGGATTQLGAAAGKLVDGTATLDVAANKLNDGAVKLKKGTFTLAEGADDLKSGVVQLHNGAVTLDAGARELKEGIKTAKDGVDTTVQETNEQLKQLDGLADYVKNPVEVQQKPISPVPNYGTAFAPYFLSLSLWVGGLMIFFGIYLDADKKFKMLGRDSDRKIVRSFAYLLIGFVQSIVLAVVIQFALGLHVNNEFLYLMSCCLVSMVFISIIQFCLVGLKDVGKFVAILLLILQLTSCGGTFPMETVPKFFNTLYPFMPMTYSVGLFKEAISGNVGTVATRDIIVLLGILAVFMTATILLSAVKRKAQEATQTELVEA